MEPSSAINGFFQPSPAIPPQIEDDIVLRRLISLHLPDPLPASIRDDLSRFSRVVLSKPVLSYVADAERNQPYLRPLTTFGVENKDDSLVTTEGWRALQGIGVKEGIVGLGYQTSVPTCNNRIYQFLKHHLWAPSSAIVTCPSAMTDGAARLLGKHLDDEHGEIFAEARNRLISRDPAIAWTSGQWMTERKGGSDVRGTETIARKLSGQEKIETDGVDSIGIPLGPWRIDGFKWFSSATDANMTVLLAKTGKDDAVSAFYAPLRRAVKGKDGESEFNGVRIQRLKNKLGTKALPTAELEIKGMRGYLIGKEGEGVKEISTLFNITRVYNSVSAVSFWGRSLAVSRAYAKVRSVGGKLLSDVPAHVRGLANDHVKYAANMHMAYFLVALLGISEGQDSNSTAAVQLHIIPRNKKHCNALLRLLLPMVKGQTALQAIQGVRACMENLGGVGYLENEDPALNVARLFRDTCVLSIWEGTTDIMADDLMRVAKGREGPECLAVLGGWVTNALQVANANGFSDEANKLRHEWEQWLAGVKSKDGHQLRWEGRNYLRSLEHIVCGCLLILDSTRDQDDVARQVARRWIVGTEKETSSDSWRVEADWDRRIVFGSEMSGPRL